MEEEFVNPIDKDKVTENPGLLPYAHTVGGAVIKPNQESVLKGKALLAMEEQTEMQLSQIKKQIDLLKFQAEEVLKRKDLSYQIYHSKMSFDPLIGKIYYLYEKEDETTILSMIHPKEFKTIPYKRFISAVKLLADHTWEIQSE